MLTLLGIHYLLWQNTFSKDGCINISHMLFQRSGIERCSLYFLTSIEKYVLCFLSLNFSGSLKEYWPIKCGGFNVVGLARLHNKSWCGFHIALSVVTYTLGPLSRYVRSLATLKPFWSNYMKLHQMIKKDDLGSPAISAPHCESWQYRCQTPEWGNKLSHDFSLLLQTASADI